MAEQGGSIEDTLMPDSIEDVTKSRAVRQAMMALWDVVQNAVDAVAKKHEGYDVRKVAQFAVDSVLEVAKLAALHKAGKIIKEEIKENPEKDKRNLQSELEEPSDKDKRYIKEEKYRTEPARRAKYVEQLSPTVLIVEPWKKLRELGKGAFGVVFLAKDKNGFEFAAKGVKKGDSKQETSLQEEICCLMKLSHQNIVKCYGYHNDEDKLYMFIELMEGSIKDKMIKMRKPIDTPDERKYTKQLLNGLMYLHASGVVHRDIKCANVLLDKNDTAKLADMGISKIHTDINAMIAFTKTIPAEYRAGSYHWMSPEFILGQEGKRRSDIWSVGCTVYEMVMQRPPFADIQGDTTLYLLAQKIESMEHRTLVFSHMHSDHELKDFLLKIFVKKSQRPLSDELSKHPWLTSTYR